MGGPRSSSELEPGKCVVVQRVSIAMCTYNGAAHVLEQLESFIAQTRQPDELIVCDDASQDETADI